MYIIKNAFRCITRAKGRNILLGLIALIIAVSCCIALSIRQAAESTREETMAGLSVTATISFDRQAMMENMSGEAPSGDMPQGEGGFDRNQFAQAMGSSSSLTVDEYLTYAEAESVDDFYYTLTASLNGSDSLLPVSTDTESTEDEETTDEDTPSSDNYASAPDMGGMGDMGGKGGMGGSMDRLMGMQSDFSVIGYSSDSAMTDFTSGASAITDGEMFAEGTSEMECVISAELAAYNNISVGDTIVFTNPNNEDEEYSLTVVGIYTASSANNGSFSIMGATAADPANEIYMSYNTLKAITDSSEDSAVTQTDDSTGMEFSSALNASVDATYVFADVDSYYQFEEEVREMGLDDAYTVSSTDLTQYENSLVPLESLSTLAGYFLLVVLLIGAAVLIVLNIFNIRERKYEIGVLTAMGMKKLKVAFQFLTEIFVVTIVAVLIGAIIGAVTAVPISNALLQTQLTAQTTQQTQVNENFGRDFGGGKGGIGGMQGGSIEVPDGESMEVPDDVPSGGFDKIFGEKGAATQYITEVNSAMNLTVLLQLLAIAVLLTLVAGAASMLFIMHYDPLKILANRD